MESTNRQLGKRSSLTLNMFLEVFQQIRFPLDRNECEHDVVRLQKCLKNLPGAHGVHVEVGKHHDPVAPVGEHSEKVASQVRHVHLDRGTEVHPNTHTEVTQKVMQSNVL